MNEGDYKTKLIKRIKGLLPGCVVLKNDPNYIQGFPDLVILYGPGWGVLEVKFSERASFQPNQEYYLVMLNEMSYANVIYPENEEVVLHELYSALTSGRAARIPECE